MFIPPPGSSAPETQPLIPKGNAKLNVFGRAWKVITGAISALFSRIAKIFSRSNSDKKESTLELSSKQATSVMGKDSATDLFQGVVVEGQKGPSPPQEQISRDLLSEMADMGSVAVQPLEDSGDLNEDLTQEVVQTAKELMKENPNAPDMFDWLTQALIHEYEAITEYAALLNGKGAVDPTLQSIREKMAEWGFQLTGAAQQVLEDLSRQPPQKLEDYFKYTKLLDEQYDALQPFASRFERLSPDAHSYIQGTLSALEQKKSELDSQMCQYVKATFKPNPNIPGVGNCLFESINHQLSLLGEKPKGQAHMRALAVDFMRHHPNDFREGIIDYMKGNRDKFEFIIKEIMETKAVDAILAAYLSQKGMTVPQWKASLEEPLKKGVEKKLERQLVLSDYYFDCLENSGSAQLLEMTLDLYFKNMETTSLWGGSNEIIAFSESLKKPVIVFTKTAYDDNWRVDMMIGINYNAKPIIIYYNGRDHYQDLIVR